MSDLLDRIIDTFPANDDTGVPLRSDLTITLSGLNYDSDSLSEGFFLEGPNTDKFVGPGLLFQEYPPNISDSLNLDDFLGSPGVEGIAQGTTTISGVLGNTLITFSPTYPLAALTEYKMNLHSVLASDGSTDIDGFVTITFETGSGSIEEVPSTVSTSILNATQSISALNSTGIPLQIVKITPSDRSVQNSIDLSQIVIEFNKAIDPTSVTDSAITIITSAVSSHPSLSVQSQGELVKSIQVSGNLLIINI